MSKRPRKSKDPKPEASDQARIADQDEPSEEPWKFDQTPHRVAEDGPVIGGFDPSRTLAIEILRRAIPQRLREAIDREDPIVLLIEVPGDSWIKPITGGLMRLFAEAHPELVSARKLSPEASDRDATIVKRPTVAITADPSRLPSEIVAGADVRTRLVMTASAVQAALRTQFGVGALVRPADIAGLDWRQIVIAIRPGSTARDCVERMKAASAKLRATAIVDRTPTLDQLAGYGPAMQTLNAVAADIVRARDGDSSETLPSLLLYGPPGTGKTTIARSLAKTVGLPLLATSVGDWFSGERAHLGTVVGNARQFFEHASANAPCVALIDELDAIPDRQQLDERDRDWWTPVVTTVLVGIDKMRARDAQVVLVGATNHISHLDKALIRPGRFDRHLEILPPRTVPDAIAVLRYHLGGDLEGEDLGLIAELALALEMTAAAIEALVRAARDRARAAARKLELKDLLDQVAPDDPRGAASLMKTALHEAAHAIAAHAIGLTVERVSIVRVGSALGATSFRDDGLLSGSRDAIEAHVVATLAGRAADELFSGGPTAGAFADLRHATRLITAVHGCFGLGSTLTSSAEHKTAETLLPFDPELKRLVGAELDRLMRRSRDLVRRHELAIRTLAERLMARRVAATEVVAAAFDQGLRNRSIHEMRDRRNRPKPAEQAPDRADPAMRDQP